MSDRDAPPVRSLAETLDEHLAPLPDLPVAEHPAAYDAVHRLLQDALGRLDEG